jgi:2-phosphosulfolactate phosphatase
MAVDVVFTPAAASPAEVGVVVDVIRATSTIAQALASGYERVLCCAELEDARALRAEIPDSLLGGERQAVRVEGFDVGASPREFLEARASTLILSTTNGTRAILETARRCDRVLLGSLLNLSAGAAAAGTGDVSIVCAGYQGGFALDDVYCAGRIVPLVGGERTHAASASALLANAFPDALSGLNARTYGPPGLEADIAYCAQVDLFGGVPALTGVEGPAAEIMLR